MQKIFRYKTFETQGNANERMWSIWMGKFADTYNRYFLYARPGRSRTLCTHMAEAGLNYKTKGAADFKRVDEAEDDLYTFPTDLVALGWGVVG